MDYWATVTERFDSARCWLGIVADMAGYGLNESAVVRARQLIEARQYVLDSDWGGPTRR